MENHFGYSYKRGVWRWWLFGGLVGLLLLLSGLWFLTEILYNEYAPWWVVLFPIGVVTLSWLVLTKRGWMAETSRYKSS